jgi:hypothetical protein
MIQPQTRPAVDTPDDTETEGPMFRSRRKAGAAGAGGRSKVLDNLEWQFANFAARCDLVPSDPVSWMQGFRWGVISTSCGAFVVALIAGVLL